MKLKTDDHGNYEDEMKWTAAYMQENREATIQIDDNNSPEQSTHEYDLPRMRVYL